MRHHSRAGQQVILTEARKVGAVTTGNTTGKLSLLQAWITRELQGKQQVAPAYTYAVTSDGADKIVEEFQARAGVIIEDCRVTDYEETHEGVLVRTSRGEIEANSLVLATGTPILDKLIFSTRIVPSRSVVVASRDVPHAGSCDRSGRWIRRRRRRLDVPIL